MGKIFVTREKYLDAIRQLADTGNDLATRYSLRQFTWQPADGERWSIAECLDHVTVSTNVYLDAMESAMLGAPAGKSAAEFRTAGLPSTKFTRSLEPPVTRKMTSPGKIRPRPTLNIEGILPQFLTTMDRVSATVRNTVNKDLNAVRFRNPLLPLLRFTVGSGFLIIAAHSRRHLWQAGQVAKQPDFPTL